MIRLLKQVLSTILLLLILCSNIRAELKVGVGIKDLTPPIGTPSAGYFKERRKRNDWCS